MKDVRPSRSKMYLKLCLAAAFEAAASALLLFIRLKKVVVRGIVFSTDESWKIVNETKIQYPTKVSDPLAILLKIGHNIG